MTLDELLQTAVSPALVFLPPKMDTPAARVQMVAIALQESALKNRVQMGGGPARSFWQMEEGGGVKGVMTHPASRYLAYQACRMRGLEVEDVPAPTVTMARRAWHRAWQALETDDVLGAIFARLLLWTDAYPLPELGESEKAWAYYLRTWRPGKPHPETWPAYYKAAMLVTRP